MKKIIFSVLALFVFAHMSYGASADYWVGENGDIHGLSLYLKQGIINTPLIGTITGGAVLGNGTSPMADIVSKGPWVDPRAFNATADYNGVTGTDNYSAFINAIAYLKNIGGGVLHVVYPPNSTGKYYFKAQNGVDPQIKIPSDVTVLTDPGVTYAIENGTTGGSDGHGSGEVNTYSTAFFVNDNMSTGNHDISIIGGNFECTSTGTGCGGFIAFKNVIRPTVKNVHLMDIAGAARMQISYSKDVTVKNYYTGWNGSLPASASFEDGLRFGSGDVDVCASNLHIWSGDDCLAINNENSETQMSITSQSGIPTYNTNGADIKGVFIRDLFCENQLGNIVRIFQGPGMSNGQISDIKITGIKGDSISNSSAGGSAISIYDDSGVTTDAISNVKISGGFVNGSQLGNGTSDAAINIDTSGEGINVENLTLENVSVPYGIAAASITNGVSINNNKITSTTSGTIGIILAGLHSRLMNNRIITLAAPIEELSGADYTYASGNDVIFSGSSCAIANNPHSVYIDNPGYNPIGTFPISGVITGSFQYTSSDSPENVCVFGGTVTDISIGSTSIGGATFGCFDLPPHTTITVDNSAVPYMTKTVE